MTLEGRRVYQFQVPGQPRGKGRPRFTTRGGTPRAYTPSTTVEYETLIRESSRWIGPPMKGPVGLSVIAQFSYNKGESKQRIKSAMGRTDWRVARPDLDNIIKVVKDALNTIAWDDDAQVAWITARKQYVEGEGKLIVWLEELQ